MIPSLYLRSEARAISSFLLSALLLLLIGCGGGGSDTQSTTTPSIPAPQPGVADVATLPAYVVRIRNLSDSSLVQSRLPNALANINWQFVTDYGPRWGLNVSAIAYSGDLDTAVPTVTIIDSSDDNVAGALEVGGAGSGIWEVRVCPHTTRVVGTGCIFDGYLSHAVGNASLPAWMPYQRCEATDYQSHTYAGPNPDLCDFDFPSSHPGAPGSDKIYLDWQGDPAYDLMHVLQYP